MWPPVTGLGAYGPVGTPADFPWRVGHDRRSINQQMPTGDHHKHISWPQMVRGCVFDGTFNILTIARGMGGKA